MAGVAESSQVLQPIISRRPSADDVVRLLGGAGAALGMRLAKDRGALALAFRPDQQSVFAVRPVRARQLLAAISENNRIGMRIAALRLELLVPRHLQNGYRCSCSHFFASPFRICRLVKRITRQPFSCAKRSFSYWSSSFLPRIWPPL